MWKIITIALVTGLAATSTPAAAFHGTAYTLTGTATSLFGDVWTAELIWSGSFGAGGSFRLLLVSGDGQSIPLTIQGGEMLPADFISVPTCGLLEIVEPYVGYDRNTGGKVFRVDGIQDNCLSNGQRHMHVAGSFLAWQLDLAYGTPFR